MIIYKTINLITEKFYIGKDLNNNPNYLGSGIYLKKAIKKYGKVNFKKIILEECFSLKELNEKEKFWIKKESAIKNGYNIAEGGSGGKTTEEPWNKGKTYEELYGKEKSNKLKKEAKNRNLGRKLSEAHKIKIGKSILGKKASKERKEKIRIANTGKIHSDETKKKISKKIKQYFKNNDKARKKISEKHIGKTLSKEHRKKISDGMKNCKNRKFPKVHQCSRIWRFYDKENNLIFEHLGNYNDFCKKNKISIRKIKKFNNLNECLNYKPDYKFKVYWEKYYKNEKKL